MERTIAQQADTLAALRQQLEEQEQEAARMRAVVAARQPPAPATGGSPGPSSSNSRSTGAGAGLLHATAQRSSPPSTTNAPGPSMAPVVQEGAAIPPVLLDLSFFKQKCNDAVNYFIAGAPAREQSFYPSLAQLRRKVQELYEDVGVPLDMFNRVMAENPERERIMLQKMSERRCNICAVVKPYAHGPGGYITENKVAMLASENIAPSRRRTPAEWHAHFRDAVYGSNWHCDGSGRPFASRPFELAICKGLGGKRCNRFNVKIPAVATICHVVEWPMANHNGRANPSLDASDENNRAAVAAKPVTMANEMEEIDKEVAQDVFDRVSFLRDQVQHYRALGGFVLLMALFVAMVYLQADSSHTFQVTSAHSVLIPTVSPHALPPHLLMTPLFLPVEAGWTITGYTLSALLHASTSHPASCFVALLRCIPHPAQNFAPDSSNRFAGAGEFYSWLNNSIFRQFWQDPPCGDGTCDQPFEFPAFGRFGCEADCGTFPNLTSVSIHFTTSFSSNEALAASSWNLCMQSPISLCWHALPQPFLVLHAQFSLALDIPDGQWALLITAPMGGVQGVLQAQKPGIARGNKASYARRKTSEDTYRHGGEHGYEHGHGHGYEHGHAQGLGEEVHGTRYRFHQSRHRASDAHAAAVEAAAAAAAAHGDGSAHDRPVPSFHATSYHSAHHGPSYHEGYHGSAAYHGPLYHESYHGSAAYHGSAFHASSLQGLEQYHEHAAHNPHASSAYHSHAAMPGLSASTAATAGLAAAGGAVGAVGVGGERMVQAADLSEETLDLPHLSTAVNVWTLLGSTDAQRIRNLQVVVSRTLYTMIKDSCLAGPYAMTLTESYRRKFTAFLCTIFGGPAESLELCRFRNATGNQLVQAEELYRHLKKVHLGDSLVITSQQLRCFIDILIAAMQSITALSPDALADLSSFFHRLDPAIVSTSTEGCSIGHGRQAKALLRGLWRAPPGAVAALLLLAHERGRQPKDDYDDPVPCVVSEYLSLCPALSVSSSFDNISSVPCPSPHIRPSHTPLTYAPHRATHPPARPTPNPHASCPPLPPFSYSPHPPPRARIGRQRHIHVHQELASDVNATFTYTKVFTRPGVYLYESGNDVGEIGSSSSSMSGMVTVLAPPPEPQGQCSTVFAALCALMWAALT
ncbi:unnamed protein product [Closterium sp. NIES-64]|nr:unnamed protein product [Closterium sp. NIES-64]